MKTYPRTALALVAFKSAVSIRAAYLGRLAVYFVWVINSKIKYEGNRPYQPHCSHFLEGMKGNSLSMTISSLAVKIASAVLVFAFLSSRIAEAEFTMAYDGVRIDHYAGYGATNSGNEILAIGYPPPWHPSSYSFSNTFTENGGTSEVTHSYANITMVLTPALAGFDIGNGTGVWQRRNGTGPPAQVIIRTDNEHGGEAFTWEGGIFRGICRMGFTLAGRVGTGAGDFCRFDAWVQFHAHDGTDVFLELHYVNNQPGSVFSGVNLYTEAPMTFNSDTVDIIAQIILSVSDPGSEGSLSAVGGTVSAPPSSLRYDFNGNSKPDYVLYNASTRQTVVWYLNNNVYAGSAYGPTLPVGWRVVDVADFNGGGRQDYALFNANTRQTAIWYLNNNILVSGAFGPALPSGWVLTAVDDFSGDSKPDFVLYNPTTRQTAIWYLNNNVLVNAGYGPTLPVGWRVVSAADFNLDGHADYLLFNSTNQQSVIWYMSGRTRIGAVYAPTIASGYQLMGVTDFDSDGTPDFVLYNASTRRTAIWYLNNNVLTGSAFGPTLPVGWSLDAP